VNFAVGELAPAKPGPQRLVERLHGLGRIEPPAFVRECLAFAGGMQASPETEQVLAEFAAGGGPLTFDSDEERQRSIERVGQMLRFIASSRDYQFA
jgi:hypothetical protein